MVGCSAVKEIAKPGPLYRESRYPKKETEESRRRRKKSFKTPRHNQRKKIHRYGRFARNLIQVEDPKEIRERGRKTEQ